MQTVTFDGNRLNQQIQSQFKSPDKMISHSNGKLTQNNRSAVYRAIAGRAVNSELAKTIAQVLGVSLADLMPGQVTVLKMTQESQVLNAALRLLRESRTDIHITEPHDDSSTQCLKASFKNRLDTPEATFQRVFAELARIGHVRQTKNGNWMQASPSLQELTRSLKRRVAFQWPIVRDAFAQNRVSRQRTSRALVELIKAAECKQFEPLEFFSIDDQIHECFCTQSFELELVQVSRAASWGIAHDLIFDLTTEMATDPQGAAQSMKMVTGWMLDDYSRWAYELSRPEVSNLEVMRREFRRHVLRMRDYAQYYEVATQGAGNSNPGSEAMC